MRIDNIANNNFQGKFIIPQKLSKKEQEFTERLINYRLSGQSNAEYLKDKNFDVNIFGRKHKKCPHRKLTFQIGLRHIGTKADERWKEITTVKSDTARLDENIMSVSFKLRNLIDRADTYIEDNLPTQYNTQFQKFLVKTAMFLRII